MKSESEHVFVVLAYQESPYLEDCLQSLEKQTVRSPVIIATSTPSTFLARISDKHGIPMAINPVNNGIASDWSFAYNGSSARYVTLAHQDDLYLPFYTESCLAAFRGHSDSIIVFTDYYELRGERLRGVTLNLVIKRLLLAPFILSCYISSRRLKRFMLCLGCPIPCPSVMYNKQIIGTFQFSKRFCCNLDWEAWLRLSRMTGSFVYVKKKLITHRIHVGSQTTVQVRKGMRQKEDREIFEKLWPRPIARMLSTVYVWAAE